jgi:hypothetical protein
MEGDDGSAATRREGATQAARVPVVDGLLSVYLVLHLASTYSNGCRVTGSGRNSRGGKKSKGIQG